MMAELPEQSWHQALEEVEAAQRKLIANAPEGWPLSDQLRMSLIAGHERACRAFAASGSASDELAVGQTQAALLDALRCASGASGAARALIAERQRQIEREGYTEAHDDEHDTGELAGAAAAYALAAADDLYPLSLGDGDYREEAPDCFPLGWTWKHDTPRRMLVKAGALVLAELERLDRTEAPRKAVAP
jgi:hypothetical protein